MTNKMLTDAEESSFRQFCQSHCSSGAEHAVWYRTIWQFAFRAGAAAERSRLLPVLRELVACKDAAGPSVGAEVLTAGYRWTDAWAAARKAIEERK